MLELGGGVAEPSFRRVSAVVEDQGTDEELMGLFLISWFSECDYCGFGWSQRKFCGFKERIRI